MTQPTKGYEFLPRMKTCPTCKADFWGTRVEHLCAPCTTKANTEWDGRELMRESMLDKLPAKFPAPDEPEAFDRPIGSVGAPGGCVSRPTWEPDGSDAPLRAAEEFEQPCVDASQDGMFSEFDPALHVIHGHPRFYEILDDLANLHSQKAQAYEGKNPHYTNYIRAGERWFGDAHKGPVRYALMRLEEKLERIRNLVNGDSTPGDESLTDNLDDCAVIAIIARILWERPCEKDSE